MRKQTPEDKLVWQYEKDAAKLQEKANFARLLAALKSRNFMSGLNTIYVATAETTSIGINNKEFTRYLTEFLEDKLKG